MRLPRRPLASPSSRSIFVARDERRAGALTGRMASQ